MIRRFIQWNARRKLAADRNRRRDSFKVRDFAKRRAAMLRVTRAA